MPWEIFERSQGYRDLAYVFAVTEMEEPAYLQSPAVRMVRRVR